MEHLTIIAEDSGSRFGTWEGMRQGVPFSIDHYSFKSSQVDNLGFNVPKSETQDDFSMGGQHLGLRGLIRGVSGYDIVPGTAEEEKGLHACFRAPCCSRLSTICQTSAYASLFLCASNIAGFRHKVHEPTYIIRSRAGTTSVSFSPNILHSNYYIL